MAGITAGPGVPSTGSIGGVTYSRNRYGAYTRSRTKPINPGSFRQARQRMRMTVANDAWTTVLSDSQRTGWANYSAGTPWLNAAGESCTLAAQAMFVRYATSVMAASNSLALPDTLDAPTTLGTGAIFVEPNGVTRASDTGAWSVTLSAPAPPVNIAAVSAGKWMLSMSPGQNPGRISRPTRWSGLNTINLPSWSAGNLSWTASAAQMTDPIYGLPYQPEIGQSVWLRVRGIAPIADDRRVTFDFDVGPIEVLDGA